jgi:hypothetical protein
MADTVPEFLTPEQARQAYGTSETFSLVDPVTELYQDSHRCKPMYLKILQLPEVQSRLASRSVRDRKMSLN